MLDIWAIYDNRPQCFPCALTHSLHPKHAKKDISLKA